MTSQEFLEHLKALKKLGKPTVTADVNFLIDILESQSQPRVIERIPDSLEVDAGYFSNRTK